MMIYGVNNEIILSDPPPYFDFNNIKNIIQQHDFIVLLDENILFDQQKIIESIEFMIQNNYDNAKGWQTKVEGGTAYVGEIHINQPKDS